MNRKIDIINVPKPNKKIVKKYLKNWNKLEGYVLQENSLDLLFYKTFPENKEIEHILIKVCTLNDFYSTNIFSPFRVAKHIKSLRIDKDLKSQKEELVNKIAKIKMANGKIYNFYSFASKYCSHHYPENYPIYDSYVEKILIYFKKEFNFYKFKREDLKDYKQFKIILQEFSKYFDLEIYSLKEIDKYLWQVGKEYFPRNY